MKNIIKILLLLSLVYSQQGADAGTQDISTTGSKSVSGLSFQPNGFMSILNRGGLAANAHHSMTFSDFGQDDGSVSIAGYFKDDVVQGSTLSYGRNEDDRLFIHYQYSDNVDADVDPTSVESDGFTMNVSDADALYDMSYLVWGGGQAKTKVAQFNPSGTTGNQSITGVGFKPSAIMFMHHDESSAGGHVGQTELGAKFMFGVSDETNDYSIVSFMIGGNGFSYSGVYNDACIINITSVLTGKASLVSFDSDGFTLNWSDAMGSTYWIEYIAIGGVEAFVGDALFQTSTGTFSESGMGFQPDVIIGLFRAVSGNSVGSNVEMGVGWATSSAQADQAYMSWSAWHNQDPTVADQRSDDGIFLYNQTYTGGTDGYIDVDSFDSDGVTFNQLDAGTADRFGYLAFRILPLEDNAIFHGMNF